MACCAWGPRSLWDQVLRRSSPAALIPGGGCLSMLEAVFLRCRLQRWPLLGLWTQCALGSGQVPWSTLDVCMLEAPMLCRHLVLPCAAGLPRPAHYGVWVDAHSFRVVSSSTLSPTQGGSTTIKACLFSSSVEQLQTPVHKNTFTTQRPGVSLQNETQRGCVSRAGGGQSGCAGCLASAWGVAGLHLVLGLCPLSLNQGSAAGPSHPGHLQMSPGSRAPPGLPAPAGSLPPQAKAPS